MTHHPHVHMIVPGGGLSPDGERWIAARPSFFLPVLVLSKLFRRLMLEKLIAAQRLQEHGEGLLLDKGRMRAEEGQLAGLVLVRHLARVHYSRKLLACCRPRRWAVFWKRHPVRASSTRRR
jgi:hypothetical protein